MSRYQRERSFTHYDFLPPEPREKTIAPGKNFEFSDAEFEVVGRAPFPTDDHDTPPSRGHAPEIAAFTITELVRIIKDKSLATVIGLAGHLFKGVNRSGV